MESQKPSAPTGYKWVEGGRTKKERKKEKRKKERKKERRERRKEGKKERKKERQTDNIVASMTSYFVVFTC
jgi:hypothetical protein